jgi:hypothetical protein
MNIKFRLFLAGISLLFFGTGGFCQVADSMAKARNQDISTILPGRTYACAAERMEDSTRIANIIQEANANPTMKNSVAYKKLVNNEGTDVKQGSQGLSNSPETTESNPH